ncbi:MAG: NAD regulator, partial [Caulobacteraceae bacterium]
MNPSVVIGLSAVIVAIREGEAVVLTVRPQEAAALPFGPFAPDSDRTFELALREFVSSQTGFELGYVEQLYTFGDRGRDAPRAEVGAGAARVVSVGYLALTPSASGGLAGD